MDEQTWLTSTDPQAMLNWLQTPDTNWFPDRQMRKFVGDQFVPMPSDRKLRLFAIACHLSMRQNIVGLDHSPEAVEAAYAVADGASQEILGPHRWWAIASREAIDAARRFTESAHQKYTPSPAMLLREVFGNPFRSIEIKATLAVVNQAVVVHGVHCRQSARLIHPWLTWNEGLIPRMAQAMYDSRDFSGMPVIADALEEAGCQNEAILRHCRGEEKLLLKFTDDTHPGYGTPSWTVTKWVSMKGPHVRGCHVLDLLLGKS